MLSHFQHCYYYKIICFPNPSIVLFVSIYPILPVLDIARFGRAVFTMTELIRDSTFGHLLRLASGGKILPYKENTDPGLWKRYVNYEKSARMAHHGHTRKEEKDEGNDSNGPQSQHQVNSGVTAEDDREKFRRSSETQVGQLSHQLTNIKPDSEKGRDIHVVDWYDEHDPEVRKAYVLYTTPETY